MRKPFIIYLVRKTISKGKWCMSKAETLEAYTLAAIGLVRGLGELAINELVARINPWPINMEELNSYINELGKEYMGGQ